MSKEYTSHTVIDGEEHVVKDNNDQLFGGEWQQKFLKEPDNMITIGTHKDPMRGPKQPSQYTIDSLYRHLLITGMSGYGTSTLVRNIQLQLIEKGYGITFIDPRGDDSIELLKSIPKNRVDDVIWIEPGSDRDKQVGFNAFQVESNPEDDLYNKEVDSVAGDFISILEDKSEYWGPQIGNTIETIVKQLIRADETFNPIDLVKIISDKEEIQFFAENYGDELEQVFINRIAEQDQDAFEPVLRRLRFWTEDRQLRKFISAESNLDLNKAINDNKIIILKTDNIQSKKTADMIIRLFIGYLWNSVKISRLSEENSDTEDKGHFLFLDQCNNIEDSLSNICTMMSQARSYKLGIIPIVQRLNEIDNDIKTCLRQTDNTITLNVGNNPSTTGTVAQLYNISSKEVSELERFEAISHVMSKSGYTSDNPVTINLFLDFQYQRDEVKDIINKSIEQYGSKINVSTDMDEYGFKVDRDT